MYFLKPYLAKWPLCNTMILILSPISDWRFTEIDKTIKRMHAGTLLHKTRADKGLPCTKLATSLFPFFSEGGGMSGHRLAQNK